MTCVRTYFRHFEVSLKNSKIKFTFTRSRSRLRIKNSQSRSRLRNPAVLQCFLLYNFFIPRLQNWFLLLTRFSVRAIPFHQTGARRRLCCPRDIFLEHVIGSDFAFLSISQINSVQFTFPGHGTGSDSFSYPSIKSTHNFLACRRELFRSTIHQSNQLCVVPCLRKYVKNNSSKRTTCFVKVVIKN